MLDVKEEGELEYHEGERVLVQRGATSKKFKKKHAVLGVVTAVNTVDKPIDQPMNEEETPIVAIGAGTYDISYDDGSSERNVSWRYIKKFNKKSIWEIMLLFIMVQIGMTHT